MALGYVSEGKEDEMATFELSLRSLPPNRNYVIASGIAEALSYLESLRFTEEQIVYLLKFPQFERLPSRIIERLRRFRFTGEVWAVKDGTVLFQNEPALFVRAPRIEAQVAETFLLGIIRAHSKFASKASRVSDAAAPAQVLEFGSRHIHPSQAVICASEAFAAGCAGTSNVEAGKSAGVPPEAIRGTMAHSYVMSFPDEQSAFRAYARMYGSRSVFLVDTYDTQKGVKNAIAVAREMRKQGQALSGIRIDSGDLVASTKMARKLLGAAGFCNVRIMISGNLDEHIISDLKKKGAVFDSVGVGKAIAACDDSPHLDAVYKLCEHEIGGRRLGVMKASSGKATYPGMKQVYRFLGRDGKYSYDEICLADEKRVGATPLLSKAMEGGKPLLRPSPIRQKKAYIAGQKLRMPPQLLGMAPAKYKVAYSPLLLSSQARLRRGIAPGKPSAKPLAAGLDEDIYSRLVIGLRDYCRESGFSSAVLGLSGGIDSALCAAIAADALGKRNVLAVFMPSRFTSKKSEGDARKMAANLGLKMTVVPIEPAFSSFVSTLSPHMKKGHKFSVVEENLQARIRANILYALSNEHGYLVLNTSNKSESAVGYGTLYGDMAGGYGVISDVLKTQIYPLCRFVNRKARKELIPLSVLRKAPSAELRHNQKDSDALPPYGVLDRIIELYFEQRKLPSQIECELAPEGINRRLVRETIAKFHSSEHKRRMAPPGTLISVHGLS
jgi:nicotinate phosphoribosyltransferase